MKYLITLCLFVVLCTEQNAGKVGIVKDERYYMESLKSFCQSCNFNEDKINKFILNKIPKTYYVEIRRIKVDKGDGWTFECRDTSNYSTYSIYE